MFQNILIFFFLPLLKGQKLLTELFEAFFKGFNIERDPSESVQQKHGIVLPVFPHSNQRAFEGQVMTARRVNTHKLFS